MQIRIGNKQDEPGCRALVEFDAKAIGLPFDLQGQDKDLKNIELSYIGRDGIFLVAEDDQNVIAFAAAARGDSEDICNLRRLNVDVRSRRRGLGKKLLDHVFFFARNLDYKTVLVDCVSEELCLSTDLQQLLKKAGFVASKNVTSTERFEFIL